MLLEIDWQGARQVREQVRDAISIFILPPSRGALDERMHKRAQDSEETIARRLGAAREEMSHFGEYDYLIVNDDFEEAVDEMCAIFTASRLRQGRQVAKYGALLDALLAEDAAGNDATT